jgi:hypothetical protein
MCVIANVFRTINILVFLLFFTTMTSSCSKNDKAFIDYQLWIGPYQSSNPDPGTGLANATVVPIAWRLSLQGYSRHISTLYFKTDILSTSPGISWEAHFNAQDKDRDDPCYWNAKYGVLGIQNSFIIHSSTGILSSKGNTDSRSLSYINSRIRGFDAATVVLVGWRFGFWNGDHHLRSIGVRIGDVRYDSEQGKVSWTITSDFGDKQYDDPEDQYYWECQYAIIAFNNGVAISKSISHLTENPVTECFLYAPGENWGRAALLLQGWRTTLSSPGDVHLGALEIDIARWNWVGTSGISFYPDVRFPDNLCGSIDNDEPFRPCIPNYELDVVGLFFRSGATMITFPQDNMYEQTAGWRFENCQGTKTFSSNVIFD